MGKYEENYYADSQNDGWQRVKDQEMERDGEIYSEMEKDRELYSQKERDGDIYSEIVRWGNI